MLNKYRGREWFRELGFTDYLLELEELKGGLESYRPVIGVMGEFSAGKSSFINSLLGEEVLPVGFTPTTHHFIKLEYGKEPVLIVKGEEGEVDWSRVEKVEEGEWLTLRYPAPILEKVSIVDTPGSNDPTFKREGELVELIEKVDLAIFIFNSTQALKESERLFLSQLISKKDRDKFLFLLNWIDGVSNPRELKREVASQLVQLMGWREEDIRGRLFLYSARQVLEGSRKELGELFTQKLLQFIENREREFIESYLTQNLRSIVEELKLKVEGYITQLEQGDRGVLEELERLKEEQKRLERELERELARAEERLERTKGEAIVELRERLRRVRERLVNEINRLDRPQLTQSLYIELRFKKLVEDELEELISKLVGRIGEIVKDLDSQISKGEVLEMARLPQPRIDRKGGLKKVGGALALAGLSGGIGVETYLALSSLPGLSSLLGAVGIGTGVLVPVAGIAGLLAGALVYKLGKWGKKRLEGVIEEVELSRIRREIIGEVEKRIKEIEGELISQIRAIDFKRFKGEYLRQKFPKRQILEEQLKRLERLRERSVEENRKKIEELKSFKLELELVDV